MQLIRSRDDRPNDEPALMYSLDVIKSAIKVLAVTSSDTSFSSAQTRLLLVISAYTGNCDVTRCFPVVV